MLIFLILGTIATLIGIVTGIEYYKLNKAGRDTKDTYLWFVFVMLGCVTYIIAIISIGITYKDYRDACEEYDLLNYQISHIDANTDKTALNDKIYEFDRMVKSNQRIKHEWYGWLFSSSWFDWDKFEILVIR